VAYLAATAATNLDLPFIVSPKLTLRRPVHSETCRTAKANYSAITAIGYVLPLVSNAPDSRLSEPLGDWRQPVVLTIPDQSSGEAQ